MRSQCAWKERTASCSKFALTVLKKVKIEVEKVCLQVVKKPIETSLKRISPNIFFFKKIIVCVIASCVTVPVAVVIVLGED